MNDRTVETSPQVYARIGGVLYLIIIIVGGFGETFRGNLVVSGDAAATAKNIMASESLWRISVAAELLYLTFAVALTLIVYVLLRPASNNLALLAAFFALVSIAVESVSRVSLFAALFPLAGTSYLNAFDPHQLQAFAYLCLRVYNYGFGISLVFFGCCLFLYGYLVCRSGYFPKWLGVFLMIGSLCYLINSFALVVAPTFEGTIFPAILLPAGLSELTFALWLLVMGVNVPKWQEKATVLS